MHITKREIEHLADEEIVAIVQQGKGDNLYLGVLYDRYKNRIYFKCISLLKDKSEAEDLAHDIFIKIFNKLHTFKGNSKFSLWVHSISFNTCISHLSKRKKYQTFEIEEGLEENIHEDDTTDFESKRIEQMRLDQLEEVILQLKTNERLLLLMRYFDGLSISEIQKLTKLGPSAIKMRLKRSRERMLAIYSEKYSAIDNE